nr:unconventional myosin-XV-like [Gorilla gorilla gorilla]
MGLGAVEQEAALIREARAVRQGGEAQAWRAAGPEPCPAGRQLRPREKSSTAAAGPGAKSLTAWGLRACRPLGVRGLPSPRPPGTLAAPQAPRIARVSVRAFPSTPPGKLRELPGPWPAQKGAPRVQRRAEGLLKRGQSGRQSRGGSEKERPCEDTVRRRPSESQEEYPLEN